METRKDYTFVLAADDAPMVSRHRSCVSLHLSSITTQREGFSLHFLPEHLPVVLELYNKLAALDVAQGKETS